MSQTVNARGKAVLPDPPVYARWNLHIPPFYACYHPYTKWMLNMIRGNAIHRLATMIKERPIIFRHYFQLADSPEILLNDNKDHICMFHRRCVLYLTPLCLAVYMKRDKVVDLLMKSGLNNPYQSCFATEVFVNKPADILEICAACVAMKREYFQALPLLCQSPSGFEDYVGEAVTLKIEEPLCLRYVTNDAKRFFRYQDLLHYGIELLQRNANYPLNRLVECLLIDCAEFYDASKMRKDANGDNVSLFRRLSRFAFYEDDQCRISLSVIACFDTLLRTFSVPWKARPIGKTCAEDPDFILKYLKGRNQLALDQDACLLLLSGLYHRLRTKSRGLSRLNQLGQVIHKLLIQMHWLPVFLNVTLEDLQLISKDINECIPLTKQTLLAMQHHVSAVDEMEKTREIVINNDLRSRRDRSRTGSFRKSCSHTAMPPPVLVGGLEGSTRVIGKEQCLTSVQHVTRPRKSESVVQPREGSALFKCRYSTEQEQPPPAPRRGHERGASEASFRSSEGLRRPPSTGSQFQDNQLVNNQLLKKKRDPRPESRGGLGDTDETTDDPEITSVTDWKEFDSMMTKSPTPRLKTPAELWPPRTLSNGLAATPKLQRSFSRHRRRSNSWNGRAEQPDLRFTRRREFAAFSGDGGRQHLAHRSAIDAYERYVLGAMFEDYDCDTSSQGDFGLTPPRRIRKPRRRSHREPR